MSKYTQGDPRSYDFTAKNQTGEYFSGLELLDPVRNKGGDEWTLISANRTGGTGDYTVWFDHAIPAIDTGVLNWEAYVNLTQNATEKQVRIIPGCLYRFRTAAVDATVTGIECRASGT